MKTFKLYLKKLLTYSGTIENEVTKANYHFKGNFYSTHTELLNIIKNGSRVLDIGCYDSSVAEMLMNKKNCIVDGIDEKKISNNLKLNKFFEHNLNKGPLELGIDYSNYDYIIMLDVIEHLDNPENFIKKLKILLENNNNIQLIFSTPNIAFFIIRISLLFGNFNYASKGILDFTHKRLFTFKSFTRLFERENFKIFKSKGIPAPFPVVLGETKLSYFLLNLNLFLIKLSKRLFAFQIFFVIKKNN
tara:strand:+ start:1278 stop:2015 length:738 start_codon:yes stop_codon:yes gene_type:complete